LPGRYHQVGDGSRARNRNGLLAAKIPNHGSFGRDGTHGAINQRGEEQMTLQRLPGKGRHFANDFGDLLTSTLDKILLSGLPSRSGPLS
jgi:hypothetical protein